MGETITAFWAEYGNVLMEGIGDTLLMTGISTVSGRIGDSTGCWIGSSM